jgi:hypothetical protein
MTYIHDPVSHNSALPRNISGGTPTALKAALGKSNVAAMLITWRYKVYPLLTGIEVCPLLMSTDIAEFHPAFA